MDIWFDEAGGELLSKVPSTNPSGDSLDPMLAVDLPCKRVFAVESEMCDRDNMRILGFSEAEIKMARDAAIVPHVADFSDITLVRKTRLRTFF